MLSSLGRLSLPGWTRHAADQHLQATIEVGFTERLSEHGRMGEALVDFTVPRRDEREWYRLRLEPLGDRVHGFTVRQLDVEQRRIARGGFDQREGIGNLRGRAEHLAPVPANGVLHLQSDESVILDDEDRKRPRTRAHEPPPQAAHVSRPSADDLAGRLLLFWSSPEQTILPLRLKKVESNHELEAQTLSTDDGWQCSARLADAKPSEPRERKPAARAGAGDRQQVESSAPLRPGRLGRSVACPERAAGCPESLRNVAELHGIARIGFRVQNLA